MIWPIKPPTHATLRKYGLSEKDWFYLAEKQKFACAICGQTPKTGRLVVDHEHVRGWKDLPAAARALYVRGLLCWVCNHYYVGRGITIEKAKGVVKYLNEYEWTKVFRGTVRAVNELKKSNKAKGR